MTLADSQALMSLGAQEGNWVPEQAVTSRAGCCHLCAQVLMVQSGGRASASPLAAAGDSRDLWAWGLPSIVCGGGHSAV